MDSKNKRKKLLNNFMKRKRAETQKTSNRKLNFVEAQNRLLRSKMKLARKRAISKQAKETEQLIKDIFIDTTEHTDTK